MYGLYYLQNNNLTFFSYTNIMKTLLVLILLLPCLATSVFGATGTPQVIFRPISKELLQKSLERGINRVLTLDLKKLLICALTLQLL